MYEFSVETVSFAECRCFLNEDELYRWQNSQADLDTLVLYLETVNGEPRFIRYGKDKKAVYFMGRRKRGVNPDTFQVLNGAFARDDKQVWTLGGVFEVADLATFEVCDSGTNGSHDYGYAKDSKQVYYENFQGKAKVVPKADPASFVSRSDGYYGFDKDHVFCGKSVLPKAKPETWRPIEAEGLSRFYTRSGGYVYFGHKLVKGADADSFAACPESERLNAKDKFRTYCGHEAMTEEEHRQRFPHFITLADLERK